MRMGMGLGLGFGRGAATSLAPLTHEFLLQAELLESKGNSNEGTIIRALSLPMLEIFRRLKSDPNSLTEFATNPRRFEEFIAACYEKDGWEKVILTPRSGDGGRDVIAEKGGFGSIRILDQCKAFSKGNLVNQEDIRAILGVLASDNNASKAVVSTTSEFSPGIAQDNSIQQFVPFRLELRNGARLLDWFDSIEPAGPKTSINELLRD